ncbi:MAG: coproporphyrinogen dehydrogenase HemZ [Oscillospiraceae bacterium]|nr:coproporphyrinogen dehydrogenase HemZ [Oscillospiraceae bacterium]
MTLYLKDDRFHYELENIMRMFFWRPEIKAGTPEDNVNEYCFAEAAGPDECGRSTLTVDFHENGRRTFLQEPADDGLSEKETEQKMAVLMYRVLSEATGKRPPFGVMTGIRPAKYMADLIERGMSPDEAEKLFVERSLVDREKARLCRLTAETGLKLRKRCDDNGFSLYVSIPFCPSRCSYCSFVSKTVERDRSMTGKYVEALCKELSYTSRITGRLGLKMQTVYIGGGTPTVLSEKELKILTDAIQDCFGAPTEGEYSVEAGRPDTITEEKLSVLKDAGVTRISINPQTANDEVLRRVGRRHTAADIEKCYEMARALGFDNINADLIAGLPGDDLESFKRSVVWAAETLRAENVTVHALTLKRASTLRETESELFSPQAPEMVDFAQKELTSRGYSPYYMYRQKGTVESLENTGYALGGKECLYNLFIMDELQSIIACGAGAVTKLKDNNKNLIERVFDMKYPQDYLERFDEMLLRKDKIEGFYAR